VAAAVAARGTSGRAFNVVDPARVSAWRFLAAPRDGSRRFRRVPLPGWCARGLVLAVDLASRLVFGPTRKLPSLCDPLRYVARFAPVRCDPEALATALSGTPQDELAATRATATGSGATT
jgi:hypothetical protein